MLLQIFSCTRVPLTGRKQLTLIPSNTLNSMAFSQYSDFIKKNKIISGTSDAEMVKRVGAKVQKAVQDYLNSKKLGAKTNGYQWEFNLIEDKNVNAFCMPGGKVAVFTGLLSVTKNEAGLAAVLGHEISHAIAEHGNERMTQAYIAQFGAVVGQVALSINNPQHINLFNQVYGLSAQGGLLAYSRKHELEADRMGMIFMAKAGFNPEEAVALWKRMSQTGGAKPPAIMSTHPSDATRIENLNKYLKEAKVYYRPR